MIGLGTAINAVAIIAGGVFGHFFEKIMTEKCRETLSVSCGICVMFIGGAGALEGMLTVENGVVSSGRAMFLVVCIALGAFIGEIIGIEALFEKFAEWLKRKTGNTRDNSFVDAFITTSFTVCIGAMAIVGAIQDGIYGDYVILATKSILDFIIVMIMTCSKGRGCVFSVIPVIVLQGSVTLVARLIKPVLTDIAMSNLSLVGSVLIFCVGINLVFGKKVRVANLLPAVIISVVFAFLPLGL